MKINFHPRGTSKTIIDKDLEAVDYFCISTVAYAAIPSCRDRKSTRLNSSHYQQSRMPSSA